MFVKMRLTAWMVLFLSENVLNCMIDPSRGGSPEERKTWKYIGMRVMKVYNIFVKYLLIFG